MLTESQAVIKKGLSIMNTISKEDGEKIALSMALTQTLIDISCEIRGLGKLIKSNRGEIKEIIFQQGNDYAFAIGALMFEASEILHEMYMTFTSAVVSGQTKVDFEAASKASGDVMRIHLDFDNGQSVFARNIERAVDVCNRNFVVTEGDK